MNAVGPRAEVSELERVAKVDRVAESRLAEGFSRVGKVQRLPLEKLQERYAFLDPASGKKAADMKRVAARSAIIVLGVDHLGRMFVLHAWADRVATQTLIDKVFQVSEVYKPRRFGIEANAQQGLFVDAARLLGSYQKIPISLTPVEQPTKITKDSRIRESLQVPISEGRIFFAENGQEELINEIIAFPMGQTVDLVDALASCVTMVPMRRATRRRKDANLERLASHLRQQGASPSYIEQRVRSFRAPAASGDDKPWERLGG